MKKCSHCKEWKESGEFNKNRWKVDGLQGYCKPCHRTFGQRSWQTNNTPERRLARRKWSIATLERNRRLVMEYLLLHPCVDCGEDDPVVLEFDHVRGEKAGHVTALMYQKKKLSVLLDEISKCEVRCANCHRRKTSRENGSYRLGKPSTVGAKEGLVAVTD